MSQDTMDRPFPVPPYGEIGGTHVADLVPQTSASAGGRRRLQGSLRRLSRHVAALEQWWQEAETSLAGDLDPEERRRLLREARGQLALFPFILEGLDTTLTTLASVDAVAASDDELRGLFDEAVRWNFGWAFHQEEAAARAAHPLDDPDRFLADLERRLGTG